MTAKSPQIAAVVAQLAEAVGRLQQEHYSPGLASVSTGSTLVDRALPGGGLRRGTLVEWISAGPGGGATSLALLAAGCACRSGGMLAVLDAERSFYPRAVAERLIPRSRLLIIRPASRRDTDWALDQLLRQSGIAAVLAPVKAGDDRTFRRLQLAAEAGGGLGLLIRPATARSTPCWASIRFAVEPLPTPRAEENRRLCLKILHCRSSGIGAGSPPQGIHLELDPLAGLAHESLCTADAHADFHTADRAGAQAAKTHAAHSLRLADPLASRAIGRHARRA
jgi:protein ImuA